MQVTEHREPPFLLYTRPFSLTSVLFGNMCTTAEKKKPANTILQQHHHHHHPNYLRLLRLRLQQQFDAVLSKMRVCVLKSCAAMANFATLANAHFNDKQQWQVVAKFTMTGHQEGKHDGSHRFSSLFISGELGRCSWSIGRVQGPAETAAAAAAAAARVQIILAPHPKHTTQVAQNEQPEEEGTTSPI